MYNVHAQVVTRLLQPGTAVHVHVHCTVVHVPGCTCTKIQCTCTCTLYVQLCVTYFVSCSGITVVIKGVAPACVNWV